MKLSSFQTMDVNLLPGLVNTALRNDCEDLDDLVRTHDIDREALETKMAEIGFRYVEAVRQFRPERNEKG
ncbi:MAG: DUF4250 domain-containing protein [Verrucomicrobiales bacterium]